MRRVPSSVPRAVTGSLSALALAAAVAATTGGAVGGDPKVEVTLTLKGDVGQYAGQCPGLGGTDFFKGTLIREGTGPIDPEEDLVYRGVLDRESALGACGTKPAPTEDQVAMCTANLTGKARMITELVVYEGDRGAYIQMAADTTAPIQESVGGCDEPAQWLRDYYPNGVSGIAIETVPSGILQAGQSYSDAGATLTIIR